MDASNPLLSQVAIFGRLLEMSEKGHAEGEEEKEEKRESVTGENSKPAAEEKRTTRGASRKKEQESSQQLKDLAQNVEAQANHYLVPPQSAPLLSKVLNAEKLQKIKEKTKAKAKFLSKEKE